MHIHFLILIQKILNFDIKLIPFPDPLDMFFVYSVFLIGYHHLKDIHKIDVVTRKYTARFLVMRWVRTLPSYYLLLTFIVLLTILFTRKFQIPFDNYLFTSNLFNHNIKVYNETWTIAIEEWFYFSFALIFYFVSTILNMSKKKSFLFIVAFYIVLSNVLKI